MTPDFTLKKYAQLCDAIKSFDCPIMTVEQFLERGQPGQFAVVLRHDVDRSLSSAMRMAELESRRGIQATYYVRMTRAIFHPPQLRQLHSLGHEVGYHYEVLSKARGDKPQAMVKFEQGLSQLRQVVPVCTMSMHGSPLLPWNNLDLWQDYDFEGYGLREASLSIDYSDVYYFTDTGRSWNPGLYNLRDRLPSLKPAHEVVTTDDLMDFLGEGCDNSVIISAHPNRWASSWLSWVSGTVSDWVINQGKLSMSLIRRRFE